MRSLRVNPRKPFLDLKRCEGEHVLQSISHSICLPREVSNPTEGRTGVITHKHARLPRESMEVSNLPLCCKPEESPTRGGAQRSHVRRYDALRPSRRASLSTPGLGDTRRRCTPQCQEHVEDYAEGRRGRGFPSCSKYLVFKPFGF